VYMCFLYSGCLLIDNFFNAFDSGSKYRLKRDHPSNHFIKTV
jgi:hypothetical protein